MPLEPTYTERARSTPKDVFLYLLLVITLYASAGSLIALLFQYVNVLLPDPLDYYTGILDSIRISTAVLLVMFPVYLFLSVKLAREIGRTTEKSELRVRKWLLHLTLFLAALAILGDTITLIYNFLNGELTVRFLLKALVILAVAGAIFGYYLWDIRPWRENHLTRARLWAWSTALLVLLSIVGGFTAVGSPFEQRRVRLDERRVSDLQQIQWQIVNYWQRKESLPERLETLHDPLSGFILPLDPESGSPYEYRQIADRSFELCATFATRSVEKPGAREPVPEGAQEVWDHDPGRKCFERTIDPELYPPYPKER